MKIRKFNKIYKNPKTTTSLVVVHEKINDLDPYNEENWPDPPHWSIYDVYDSGMEGRDHWHVKYILASSKEEAWKNTGYLSASKIENTKRDPNSKNSWDRIRVKDEIENYEIEKKKLEKIFYNAKNNLDNFNTIYNEWKSKNTEKYGTRF